MIGIQDFFEAAKAHELLKGFEPQHLEKLVGLAREAEFQRDSIIFHQGAKVPFFYLLTKGRVALEWSANGQRVTVQELDAGAAMGWSAVTDASQSAHFDARALTPVHTIAFDGVQLRAACESDPYFGYAMMKALFSLACERLDATRIAAIR